MDPRWDITYLGMQIMVEGLALAAFGFIHQMTDEPLLKKLLRYVMATRPATWRSACCRCRSSTPSWARRRSVSARSSPSRPSIRLRNRWFHTDVWERMGVDPRPVVRLMLEEPTPEEQMFRMMLFSKIVPNCKKLGLLDAGDGWLRERFEELGIIQFEDWVDTTEEYADLDEVAKDRAEG